MESFEMVWIDQLCQRLALIAWGFPEGDKLQTELARTTMLEF